MKTEAGFAAVEWTLGLGLIVLPLAVMVASVAPWFERANMAHLIAQEAARTIVLADDFSAGETDARALGEEIAQNYGFSPGDWCAGDGCVSMDVSSTTPGVLGRGSEVTVTIEVPMPGVTVPFLTTIGEFQWSADHIERVDDYRSFP